MIVDLAEEVLSEIERVIRIVVELLVIAFALTALIVVLRWQIVDKDGRDVERVAASWADVVDIRR